MRRPCPISISTDIALHLLLLSTHCHPGRSCLFCMEGRDPAKDPETITDLSSGMHNTNCSVCGSYVYRQQNLSPDYRGQVGCASIVGGCDNLSHFSLSMHKRVRVAQKKVMGP